MWLADNPFNKRKVNSPEAHFSRILFTQPRYFMRQPSKCGIPAKAEVSVSHPRHSLRIQGSAWHPAGGSVGPLTPQGQELYLPPRTTDRRIPHLKHEVHFFRARNKANCHRRYLGLWRRPSRCPPSNDFRPNPRRRDLRRLLG